LRGLTKRKKTTSIPTHVSQPGWESLGEGTPGAGRCREEGLPRRINKKKKRREEGKREKKRFALIDTSGDPGVQLPYQTKKAASPLALGPLGGVGEKKTTYARRGRKKKPKAPLRFPRMMLCRKNARKMSKETRARELNKAQKGGNRRGKSGGGGLPKGRENEVETQAR